MMQMAFHVVFMSFVVVVATCLLLIPFMEYGLGLSKSGWSAGHVALFGAAIAGTDGVAVTAAIESGKQTRGCTLVSLTQNVMAAECHHL